METHTFKVLVAGPFASGKTTLINEISDGPVTGTERPTSGPESAVKETTTVGIEFGVHTISDDAEGVMINLHLFGVPGQRRFAFMWDIASQGLDGLLLLVDATRPETWDEARDVGAHIGAGRVPVVVGVNRVTDPGVVAAVAATIGIADAYVVCDVVDPVSVRETLVEVLVRVLDELTEQDEAELLTGRPT